MVTIKTTMWITADVELPMELVEAHAAGKLVLFVGAGASRNSPSNLPLFDELAVEIGNLARRPYPGEGVPIDRFLGELDGDFDVHKHVKRIISRPGSVPNATHTALARLVAAAKTTRVVTTNFDEHLQTAADNNGTQIGDIYFAPALPVGRDFEGIVHLHGLISRPDNELILTDHDFGRAYLTDAWAPRFLREVFEHFVVLFVGFSHNDPIMNYLGMGLPSSTRRFILTDQADDPRWKRLGIKPVAYPNNNHHAAAARAIDEWAKRASMGHLDHRARIQDIVRGGPPKNPVETDYLSHMLEDPTGVAVFAETAADVSWLSWLENHEAFSSVFRTNLSPVPGSALAESTQVLAQWFCDKFISDSEQQAASLDIIQRTGQKFSPQLLAAMPWAIRSLTAKDQDAARRWTVLLTTSIEGYSAPPSLDSLLGSYRPGAETRVSLPLRQGLRPYLRLRTNYWGALIGDVAASTTLPMAELNWPLSEYAANEYSQVLKNLDSPFDYRLSSLFENALLNVHGLLDAWEPQGGRGGGLSFARSAIEDHPQDTYRHVIDVVIDGLRDCGQELIASDPGLIERWWSISYPLFRRLAVHLLGCSPAFDPTTRIQWLLDKDLIFEFHTKHETYAVLAAAVRDASPAVKSALLERIERGPSLDDEIDTRHVEYMKYNILTWLTTADTTWAEANTALRISQTNNSDFEPRSHPDFDHWSESGTWVDASIASVEEFTQMIQVDGAGEAMVWLLNQDYAERAFNKPTWDNALGLLRSVAESAPAYAVDLWNAPVLSRDDRTIDIRSALIYGWAKADLGDNALKVINLVATLTSEAAAVQSISDFLRGQIDRQPDTIESEFIVQLRGTARRLWIAHSASFAHEEDFDPVSLSLNSWPGKVATYWIREIGRRWRADPDNWAGLSDDERAALLTLGQENGPTLDATRPVLAGEVFFLFGADPDFTVENVFPWFSASSLKKQSWGAYLYQPRWNNKFLERGFLSLIVDAHSWIDELSGDSLPNQYWGLFAAVLTYSDITHQKRADVLDELAIESGGKCLVQLIDHLTHILERQETVEVVQSWDTWIGDYVQRRFDGQPSRPSPEELEAWADLIPILGDGIPTGVDLVLTQRLGFRDSFRWDEESSSTVHPHEQPLARYLIHRLKNTSQLSHGLKFKLVKMGVSLIGNLGSVIRDELIAAGAEHGISFDQHR